MPNVTANGIQIEYDSFGSEEGRPLLLIMGLGTQMVGWDEGFCASLAERGHFVVRFDNRDVGKSTIFENGGVPEVVEIMAKLAQNQEVEVPYLLSDMASDTAGLMAGLGIESAHVVGASMGGMIAQSLAIQHPSKVRSLTSIMSSTGQRGLPPAKPEAMAQLLRPAATTRDEAIERTLQVFRVIGSPGFEFDEQRLRNRAALSYDRGFHPEGPARQLAALLASGSRKESLESLRTPTLVIHGQEDPLVPVECGIATHEAISGSELLVIDGMGHDLPREVWPRIVDAISKLTTRSEHIV